MASGFKINKQAIRKMQQDLQKEVDKNPVRVPVTTDSSRRNRPSASTITNNYHGPIVTVNGNNAQLAWDSQTVNQTQSLDIAPGLEELAEVLTALLAGLPAFSLSDNDAADVESTTKSVLGEVVREKPDRGVIKSGVMKLKGLLAPMAIGVSTAVSEETAERAKTMIELLGSSLSF